MLRPSAAELLIGVADALAATVLGELEPGPARDQVQAAIGITRRVARVLPHLMPYLVEDTADLAVTLRQLLTAAPTLAIDGVETIVAAEELPAGPVPSLDELTEVNLRLRDTLAGVAETADLDPQSDGALRALLGRMTAREAALRLSPWER